MSSNRKYAALPDLDSAPDIYETPELTDDNSTVPPTTVRSPSDDGYDDDDEDAGISRSRLRIDDARARFMPAAVDATEVDFSDRLDGKRKSYKASNRRHRILEDGTEELGDLSDNDDAGNLTRRIARLKREIEEAKEDYGKQKSASAGADDDLDTQEGELESLSKTLDEISRLDESLIPKSIPLAAGVVTGKDAEKFESSEDFASFTVTYSPTYEQTHALAKAADFDRRLVMLEKSLGVGSAAMPELDSNGLPRAIIPLLETLNRQVSTLSNASTASLDSISRRVRILSQEAETLEKNRRNAKAAHDALIAAGAPPTAEEAAPDDSEQMAKINALYGTLPTIESLAPLLPPLLDRLRSLRLIHADAATASETLASLEQKQSEMAAEIHQWKDGLEKVELAMRDGDAAMEKNMHVMAGWVKDLESKMSKLS